MGVNRRGRPVAPGVARDVQGPAPRSGGRTAAGRNPRADAVRDEAHGAGGLAGQGFGGAASGRGVRAFPTSGTAALRSRPDVTDPVVDADGRPSATGRPAVGQPRLRVAPPPPMSVPRAPFVALVLALVVGGVLGILVINTKINENAFRLDRLQRQQVVLDERQDQLEKQIAEAEAPGNLAAQARRLGLVESGPPAFIRLPDGQVIGVPQPAGGELATNSEPVTSSEQGLPAGGAPVAGG